jgi:hypothetical protein
MIFSCQKNLGLSKLSLWRIRTAIVTVLVAIILSPSSQAETVVNQPSLTKKEALSAIQRESVVALLKSYAENSRFGPDRTTRYSAAEVPNTKFIIAYLQGDTWCGSGGCTLLVLKPSGSSYSVAGKILAVHAPILDMNKITKSFPELGVWVRGGGIEVGYETVLTPKRGGKYPLSSVISKKRVSISAGKTLISAGDQGVLLFQ